MVDLFQSRRHHYTHAVVSLAMNRTDGKPMLLRGAVRFDKGVVPKDERLEYKSLILSRRYMHPDDGLAFAQRLYARGACDDDEFRMPGKYNEIRKHSQNNELPLPSNYLIMKNDWPSEVFVVKHSATVVNDPRGPLMSSSLPICTNPQWAITKWIGFDTDRMVCPNGVAILLPDFRARISRIRIGDMNMLIEIERNELNRDSIIAKVEAGWGESSREIRTEKAESDFFFSFEKSDSVFQIFIMDEGKEEVVDWIHVNTEGLYDDRRIEFTTPSKQIEQMIEGGETQQVEFKSKVGNGDDMVESILAFANTNDGVILIGVDDNGTAVGVDDVPKEEQRILEFVDFKCEPVVANITFSRHSVGGKNILAVHVPKGSNTPYLNRETGITYTRRNSTDRRTRRIELERLFSDSSTGFGVR
jgi:hypothetical protein